MYQYLYDPVDDPASEAPVSRFLIKVLLDADKRSVDRIHFRRFVPEHGNHIWISVRYEKDGAEREICQPPFEWHQIISRLKIMACMVDYGPGKSTDGHIRLRLAKNRMCRFRIESNPNPHSDNAVAITCKGTKPIY